MVEVYTTYQMIVPRESVIQVPQKKTWSLLLELSARTKGRCAHFMALGTASCVSFLGRELGARARQLRLEALHGLAPVQLAPRDMLGEGGLHVRRTLADSRAEWMTPSHPRTASSASATIHRRHSQADLCESVRGRASIAPATRMCKTASS